MKKLIILAIFAWLFALPALFAATIVGGSVCVDGLVTSTQTVITSRQPLFSWEYSGSVSSFTIVVSADPLFASTVWNYTGSTTTANTVNFITRVPYNIDTFATALSAKTVYYWQVTIYDNGVSASSGVGQFTTITSAANLSGEKYDLAVDWNNPFNPSNSQITKFRFIAKDRDRKLQLRVFTLSGELVTEWPEQTAIQGAVYTQEWDGKNNNNEIVARGIYLVNLMDVGDKTGVTRKVAVVNGNQ